VQPHVVALGLDEPHVVAAHPAGPPGQLHRDRGQLVDGLGGTHARRLLLAGRPDDAADPGERTVETFRRHRFEQVVQSADAVGRHGVLLERGDEHDLRRVGQPRQQRPQLQPVHARHRDVEERRVERAVAVGGLDQPQRRHRVAGRDDLGHARRVPQQSAQVVEGGRDVVDDQDP